MISNTGSSNASFARLGRLSLHEGNQQRRIQNGESNGSLTAGEAGGLKAQQQRIAQAKGEAMADGFMDRNEFRELRQMQRGASRDIFEQKHNGCERAGASAERSGRVETRQGNQDQRIQNGVSDGSLGAEEVKDLMDQQKEIAEAKGAAMADGKMDAEEFQEIRKLLKEASQSIYEARHNNSSTQA